MNNLQWKGFSPDTFRNFCNALLWLEIGNDFRGYEAPGKDGGIDGSFSGSYNNQFGLWRFQYKFHSTERKKAFQSLKSELKAELKKIGRENQFVLLTNVALLPKELTEIEVAAQEYLTNEGFTDICFAIWDSAILSRLYIKYPLLKLWMEEGYTTGSLVPYKDKFEKRLSASVSSIDTLTNLFVSREEELNQLSNFLNDTEKHLTIIKGEAGIGKTRLAIEFFKNYIDGKSEWIALCVNQYNLDFDKLRFSLSDSKKYILLVDDAQNFTSQQLADLYRLGGHHNGGTIKLVFTIRGLASYEAFRLVNSFDRHKALLLTLEKLSKEDTRRIFEAHLKHDYLRNFIDQLVLISRGRPILIVGMLSAAERGENVTKIKSQTDFTDYVVDYFSNFLKIITQNTGVDNLKAAQFLGLVCLLEPFPYGSPKNIEKLASVENVSEDYVLYFLNQLREQGISTGSYQHSIKPDYYSDIILKWVLNSFWLEKKLSQYTEFSSNILTNLASLDEVENDNSGDGRSLLDKYLSAYIEDMEHSPSSDSFKERLRVANNIAFQKPGLAQRAVQLFIFASSNQDHPFYRDYIAGRRPEMLKHEASFSLVRGILSDLLYYPDSYDFIFDVVLQLYRLTKDKNWFDVFSYSHPIYLYQSSIQIQKFFVKRASELLPESEEETILFLIHGLHELLSLSFNSTRWGVLNENTIQISKHFLPKVPVVERYRLSILSALKTYYLHYKSEVVKLEALKNIIDVPREIAHSKRNEGSYHSDAEIKFILEFLVQHATDASISCQKVILDELYWYKRQRVDKKFHWRIRKIEKLLIPQSLAHRFVQAFSYLENLMEDRGDKAKKLFNDLLHKRNSEEIGKAFSELYQATGGSSYYYPQIIQHFTIVYTTKAKETYSYLKTTDKAFLHAYGSHFLKAFRNKQEHEDFFWQEVKVWLDEANTTATNVLLHSYSFYSAETLRLTKRDATLLEKLSSHHNNETEYNLAHALPTLFLITGEKSEPFLVRFLNNCGQQNAEHIFGLLLDERERNGFLRNLFLKNSLRFTLTHFLEHTLLKVAQSLSADELFQYFLERYNYIMNLEGDEHYRHEFVPIGDHNFFAEKLEQTKRLALFEKALSWFVSLQGDYRAKRLGENLVDYLKPSHDINEDLTAIYRRIYQKCKDDEHAVLHLVDSLDLFHNKSTELISLINDLASDIVHSHSSNAIFLAEFKSYCRSAITAAGVKSGTPGQPFAFDLNLKNLLVEVLPIYEHQRLMKEILTGALNYTEATIAADSERESSEVW